MAVIQSNTSRQAYNATVDLYFQVQNQNLRIQAERIKYIVIDTNYETEIMPKIYMSISVNTTLYNYITNYKSEAKFKLVMRRKNVYSKSAVEKTIIDDTFAYIPSTTNADYLKDITSNDTSDDSYRNIVVGLISTTITDSLRKSFNLVYNNIDQQTLISLALEGSKAIVQPLQYNKKYDSILIPPVSSVNEFISYIFEVDNFYNTNFLFFKDYNRTYLLARDGTMVPDYDGNNNDIYIDIKNINNGLPSFDGINEVNGSYYLYINPMDSNVIIPNAVDKIVNRLVVVDDDEELQTLDLNINNSFNQTIKEMFVRAENGSVIKNEIESENVIVEVTKTETDGYYFTPNKTYIVSNFGTYSKYNGKYMIVAKKEYFRINADKEFTTCCYLALKKIGKTATKMSSYISDKKKVELNTGAKITNTADMIKTINSVPAAGNR